MSVLILHQHFKTPRTGGALRSYYLATALASRGIRTVVITAHNESRYEIKDEDGVEVHYLPIRYENRFGFLARVVSFIRFTIRSAQIARKCADVRVCYAISVPLTVGWTARWLKSRNEIPYIFEVGDLWPEAPIQLGFIQNRWLVAWLYRMERRIYEAAESIVVLSEPQREYVLRCVPDKIVHLIPNMSDVNFFSRKRTENSDEFTITYAGALGIANGLQFILECAKECVHAQLRLKFVISGDGAMAEKLKAERDRLGLTNVEFRGHLLRQGVRQLLEESDAIMVCYASAPVLETGSPNKYFDGLAAGKLIIVNFGGWIRSEIEGKQCGFYVDPMKPKEFADRIRAFIADRDLLGEYQRRSRLLAESSYSREALSGKFAEIFKRR